MLGLLGENFEVSAQMGTIAGGAICALLVLFILKKLLFGKKVVHKDLQKGLREKLEEYPAPPRKKSDKAIVVDGIEVRVRLIVIAPIGKDKKTIDADDIPEILDDMLRGLGASAKADMPRMRVWPPQLSVAGFAPTFFRLVESPDEEGKRSSWIRVAGPVKIASHQYLLGMAFWSEEKSKLGMLNLAATEWSEHLHIQKV